MEAGEISGSDEHDDVADQLHGRGSAAVRLPPMEEVKFKGSPKFKITQLLGTGGFGQVWEGESSGNKGSLKVAVKFEKTDSTSSKSEKEWEAYKALSGIVGVPRMHYHGTQGKYDITIIDLLGKSLKDLLSESHENLKYQFESIAIQMIKILEAVHSRGYLHGDIKPGNLLIDRNTSETKVFLTDFGLATRWKDDQDTHVKYGQSSFEGTVEYASVHTLLRRMRSRRDDMESLAYTLIRLHCGLPWQEAEEQIENLHIEKNQKYFNVCEKKMSASPEELCCHLPTSLRKFYNYAIELEFDEEPDYEGCILLFNDKGSPKRKKTSNISRPMQVRTGNRISQWISVLDARQPIMQRYHYGVKSENLQIFVDKWKEEKLFIQSVASKDNLWALILDAGTGFSDQIYKYCCDFGVAQDWFEVQWNKGYFITSAAGAANGSSLIVMSKGTKYGRQEYKVADDLFPLNWVKSKWKEGLCITSMATAGSKWAIFMSVCDSLRNQEIELDFAYPYEGIHKRWEQGFIITAIAATPKQAAFVFSKPQNPTERCGPKQNISWTEKHRRQDTYLSSDFPSRYIKDRWDKNVYISSVCYGRTMS